MKIAILMTAIFSSLLILNEVHAQPSPLKVSEATSYYTIRGNSAKELAVYMRDNAPYFSKLRGRSPTKMTIEIDHKLKMQTINGKCFENGSIVNLRLRYLLPRLSSTSRLSKQEQRKWNAMLKTMKKDHRNFEKLAKRTASRLHRGFARMRPSKTCKLLEDQYAIMANRHVQSYYSKRDRLKRKTQQLYKNIYKLMQ